MRRSEFEACERCFENTTEHERSHAGNIGGRDDLPLARRAIIVAPQRPNVMVLMIVDDAEDERHAQIWQANQCSK